jgi:predicted O-methyltransferase YrrM
MGRQRWAATARVLRHTLRRGVPQLFPPGAFYSPVVDAAAVTSEPERSRVWPADPQDPAGIDVREAEQLALLASAGAHRLPTDWTGPGPFDPDNDQFPLQDAGLLYGLVRHLRPSRVVEVGSGWSTTVTRRAIADGGLPTTLTCIEPYPRAFVRAMEGIELRVEKVEHTPAAVFDELEEGDVLFIDTSHVAKTGSDVVHLVLQVLPRLARGVVVHVHDIFIPEDYPTGWVETGFGWNEQYVVQAFLTGHAEARVLAMNHWLSLRHPGAVAAAFGPVPLHGSSLYFSV